MCVVFECVEDCTGSGCMLMQIWIRFSITKYTPIPHTQQVAYERETAAWKRAEEAEADAEHQVRGLDVFDKIRHPDSNHIRVHNASLTCTQQQTQAFVRKHSRRTSVE